MRAIVPSALTNSMSRGRTVFSIQKLTSCGRMKIEQHPRIGRHAHAIHQSLLAALIVRRHFHRKGMRSRLGVDGDGLDRQAGLRVLRPAPRRRKRVSENQIQHEAARASSIPRIAPALLKIGFPGKSIGGRLIHQLQLRRQFALWALADAEPYFLALAQFGMMPAMPERFHMHKNVGQCPARARESHSPWRG